jgi:hypothetical protein
MSIFLIVFACFTVCVSLISITRPDLYKNLAKIGGTKKSVGPTYWGYYAGCAQEEPVSMKVIEAPSKEGKHKVVAGSSSYARGNGPSAEAG